MKILNGLVLIFALSLLIISCNSATGDQASTEANPAPTEKEEVKTPAEEASNGAVVEKTEIVPEAPVDDAGVDYNKLAAAVCKCSAKFKGHDDGHEGDVHVQEGDTEYQAEVDCSIKAKNEMTSGDISRQKLVTAIKNNCADIPGKLVMRLMMTIGS